MEEELKNGIMNQPKRVKRIVNKYDKMEIIRIDEIASQTKLNKIVQKWSKKNFLLESYRP